MTSTAVGDERVDGSGSEFVDLNGTQKEFIGLAVGQGRLDGSIGQWEDSQHEIFEDGSNLGPAVEPIEMNMNGTFEPAVTTAAAQTL